jgi:transcriptional regulator with XRE-family HTH domain
LTYLAKNIRHLRKRSSKTQEQLGQDIRLGRSTIANYEAGFSSPTDPEVLIRLSNVFGVSIDELLTRDLSVAFANTASGASASLPEPAPDVLFLSGNGRLPEPVREKALLHPQPATAAQMIVVDSAGEEPIVFVSSEAAPAYADRRAEGSWLASLPLYKLPGLRAGTHRIFEVADAAMGPRFSPGDRVVCRLAGSPGEVQDGHAYLLVTPSGLWLRRVINRLPQGGGLLLLADEPAAVSQAPAVLHKENLLEIWSVEWVMSSRLAPPVGQVYGRIADLEQQLQALSTLTGRPAKNPT